MKDIELPSIVTIKNVSNRAISYIPIRQNFAVTIEPYSTHKLEVLGSEAVMYYLGQAIKDVLVVTYEVKNNNNNNVPDIPIPPNYNLFEFSDINSKECVLIKINKNSPLYDNGSSILEIPDTNNGKKVTRIGNGINPLLSDDWTIEGLAIPDSVIRIEKDAFKYWKVLKNVWLGSGIESIGEGAFTGGNNLLTWEMTATTPPLLESYALGDYKPAKIYVPIESLETYKTNSAFKNIADRIASK